MGLIKVQLLGLTATVVIGLNPLSTMAFRVDIYLSILLFTGFIAYDTHASIKNYNDGLADHLGMSVQFLLDIWNVFTHTISSLFGGD